MPRLSTGHGHFELARPWVHLPRREQHREREHGRHQQRGEGGGILPGAVEHQSHDQRADQGAGLVHGFVQPETPSPAHLMGRVGQHGVARRRADGLARPLQHHEGHGCLPSPRQRECWHGQQIQPIADQGDRPVPPRPVAQIARGQPEAVPEEFAEPSNNPDHRGRRPQVLEVRAGDAPPALVRHVREQAHDPEKHDESEGGPGRNRRRSGC